MSSRKQRPELWRDDIARDLTDDPPFSWMLAHGNAAEQREYWRIVAAKLREGTLHEDGRRRLAAAVLKIMDDEPAKRAFGLNAGNRGSYGEELKLRESVRHGEKSKGVRDAEQNLASAQVRVKRAQGAISDAQPVKQARTRLKQALDREKKAIKRLKK